jgi:thymidylate synthase ThyX
MNGTIRSWLHYCDLRTSNGTQREHAKIAASVQDLLYEELPNVCEAMWNKDSDLNEFKALYKTLKTGTTWVDHLLLGLLYWLEEKLINNRVKVEVDEAIKSSTLQGETLHKESLPDLVSPVYTESPSETSESLPEMRLTAPWYVSPDNDVKGR